MKEKSNECVEVVTKKLVEPPLFWRVLIHNDDVTPMGFVIQILKDVFDHDNENSVRLMFKAQSMGSAVVGRYLKSIADSKKEAVHFASRRAGYPLKATVEADS